MNDVDTILNFLSFRNGIPLLFIIHDECKNFNLPGKKTYDFEFYLESRSLASGFFKRHL